jgi:hypothetical protein
VDGRNCRPPFYQTSRSLLDNRQLFATGTRTDLGPIKGTQIEVATTPSAKHKADGALIPHTLKEAKAMHVLGSRVPLPLAAFSDRCLMQLSVVSSDHLDEVPCAT